MSPLLIVLILCILLAFVLWSDKIIGGFVPSGLSSSSTYERGYSSLEKLIPENTGIRKSWIHLEGLYNIHATGVGFFMEPGFVFKIRSDRQTDEIKQKIKEGMISFNDSEGYKKNLQVDQLYMLRVGGEPRLLSNMVDQRIANMIKRSYDTSTLQNFMRLYKDTQLWRQIWNNIKENNSIKEHFNKKPFTPEDAKIVETLAKHFTDPLLVNMDNDAETSWSDSQKVTAFAKLKAFHTENQAFWEATLPKNSKLWDKMTDRRGKFEAKLIEIFNDELNKFFSSQSK